MDLRPFFIVLLLFPLFCNAQKQTVKCEITVHTIDEKHVELLHKLMKSAKTSKDDEKAKFEQQFFCNMPNSFDKMLDLLYLESTITYNKIKDNGKPPPIIYLVHPFVRFFSKLETIDANQYYDKYINICVDGFYAADEIREGFQIHERIENDTKAICKVLAKRNDKDIKSVFRFIFDSSHPDNEVNREIYNTIYPLVIIEDKRLGDLLKSSFEQLLKDKRH